MNTPKWLSSMLSENAESPETPAAKTESETNGAEQLKTLQHLDDTVNRLLEVQQNFLDSFTFLKKELTGKIIEDTSSPTGFRNKKTGRLSSSKEFETQEFVPEAATPTSSEPGAETVPGTAKTSVSAEGTHREYLESIVVSAAGIREFLEGKDKGESPTEELKEEGPSETENILKSSLERVEAIQNDVNAIRLNLEPPTADTTETPTAETADTAAQTEKSISATLEAPTQEEPAAESPSPEKSPLEMIAEDVKVIRETIVGGAADAEKERDKAAREKPYGSFGDLFGDREKKKKKKDEEKKLPDNMMDIFGISDLMKMFTPVVKGLLMPMLSSLFGGPLGIIASIGLLIMDIFKGLKFSEILGVSKASGIIGAIFGGDMAGGMVSAFKNAGKWAIMGATIGSFVPVVGTLIGGIVGAALGGILGWIGGGQIALWIEQAIDGIANWWDTTVVDLLDFTDILKDIPAKMQQTFNSFVSGIVSSIFNFVGDIWNGLASIEIGIPKDGLMGKAAGLIGLPDSIKPFSFLGGMGSGAKSAAEGTKKYFDDKNAKIQEGIDERSAEREERHAELEKTKEERAKKEADAAKELERIKKGESPTQEPKKTEETKTLIAGEEWKPGSDLSEKQMQAVALGQTQGVNYSPELLKQYNKQHEEALKVMQEPTRPETAPTAVATGTQLDEQSREMQRAKERAASPSNIVAPVTNNVVNTKGPTNNIVHGMPSSRSSESSWSASRNKNYAPS